MVVVKEWQKHGIDFFQFISNFMFVYRMCKTFNFIACNTINFSMSSVVTIPIRNFGWATHKWVFIRCYAQHLVFEFMLWVYLSMRNEAVEARDRWNCRCKHLMGMNRVVSCGLGMDMYEFHCVNFHVAGQLLFWLT